MRILHILCLSCSHTSLKSLSLLSEVSNARGTAHCQSTFLALSTLRISFFKPANNHFLFLNIDIKHLAPYWLVFVATFYSCPPLLLENNSVTAKSAHSLSVDECRQRNIHTDITWCCHWSAKSLTICCQQACASKVRWNMWGIHSKNNSAENIQISCHWK